MPKVDLLNMKGEVVGDIELSENIFGVDVNESVLHEVVTMQLASRRSGSASVKHRSDVKGSGRKLFISVGGVVTDQAIDVGF